MSTFVSIIIFLFSVQAFSQEILKFEDRLRETHTFYENVQFRDHPILHLGAAKKYHLVKKRVDYACRRLGHSYAVTFTMMKWSKESEELNSALLQNSSVWDFGEEYDKLSSVVSVSKTGRFGSFFPFHTDISVLDTLVCANNYSNTYEDSSLPVELQDIRISGVPLIYFVEKVSDVILFGRTKVQANRNLNEINDSLAYAPQNICRLLGYRKMVDYEAEIMTEILPSRDAFAMLASKKEGKLRFDHFGYNRNEMVQNLLIFKSLTCQ